LLGIAKFRQQMRYVADDLRVADADLFGIVPPYQINEQLLQRMRF
jgi:hypothetical protein